MDKPEVANDSLFRLLAEMVVEQSLRSHRISALYTSIDEALTNGDKEQFLALTKELNKLLDEEKIASAVS